jgi:hypothetical protein
MALFRKELLAFSIENPLLMVSKNDSSSTECGVLLQEVALILLMHQPALVL